MFGCPRYKANGKLFTFLVTNGLVIVNLSQTDREELSRQFQTTPFQAGKKRITKWPHMPLKTATDLEQIMPFVQKSYEFTLQETWVSFIHTHAISEGWNNAAESVPYPPHQ